MPLPIPRTDGPVVIAVDSTGMKVTTRGEWMREKHHRKRGWIKIHLCVDVDGGRVAIEVTDERVGDSTLFPALIEGAERVLGEGRIVEALADGAYDTRRNFQLLDEKGIGAGIHIKRGDTRSSKGSSAGPRAVRELTLLVMMVGGIGVVMVEDGRLSGHSQLLRGYMVSLLWLREQI